MRNTAQELLPKSKVERDRLYSDLNRGKDILDDDDHLNMYLHSFGKMHKAKLDTAFSKIPHIQDLFKEEIEVYDWGCGQGTATICLLDFLAEHKIPHNISSLNLIEPSEAAVRRASAIIESINPKQVVRTVIKDFDQLSATDFEKSNARKIHLFSNILDVEAFALDRFIHLFQNSFNAENTFVCVGPYYTNSRRIGEFIAATDPDIMFATMDKDKGQWQNEWTISLRLFNKTFKRVESLEDIRKRIEESHKQEQFFAGYILDAVAEEYQGSELSEETEALYHLLSAFNVKSNIQLGINDDCDPKFSVLANIISRGLPTKAPVYLEETFSKAFGVSKLPTGSGVLNYQSAHHISDSLIYEALHVIDPRFNSDYYNGDVLESSFEKGFIERSLKSDSHGFLVQVLEPQRPLSSIVDIPDANFHYEQRIDFALDIPYGQPQTGFIVEIDGKPYHSNLFQRLHDEIRDKAAVKSNRETYHIEELKDVESFYGWAEESNAKRYLETLQNNYKKSLTGEWNDMLQIVLSPLAIARLERILVEALMAKILDLNAKEWDIVIVERDVPCAAIALKDLQDKIEHLWALTGTNLQLPTVNLCIVSTEEFKESPLHLGQKVYTEIPQNHFDLCLDISLLLRDNIDALPLSTNADAVYILRSAHYKKRERTMCTAECIQYPPLVTKNSVGKYESIAEREAYLTYFLQEVFRKASLRPGQLPIISHALEDKTTIGLLPTGGGKSLTYQLSCILQPGIAVVVDPLVSLMVDQVRGLRNLRIDCCDCVNSGMTSSEKAQKLNLLQRGSVLFMFLSPERFMMPNFRESLVAMTEKNHIYFSYGIVDEVHCVSEWGHDFRTSYLHLGRNMINFMHTKSRRPLSLVGLTATASFDVLADVERELTLGGNLAIDSEAIIRPESDTRPELTYRIIKVIANFDELRDPNAPYLLNSKNNDRDLNDWDLKNIVADAKMKEISLLLDEIPTDIAEKNLSNSDNAISNYSEQTFYTPDNTGKYPHAGIIFCPHRNGTWGVSDGKYSGISTMLLSQKENLLLGTFVGGDKPSGDMDSFNNNDMNLMVATKAFGMGIDKPNIRYTINFNHPSSIESYVQEAGRGGRDKQNAISYILYEPTEYIHLTVDKINDIRYMIGKDEDPIWLERYANRYVLFNDFPQFCESNGASEEQTQKIIGIIHKNGYLENVDKGINLWFHNNSFKGLLKEKAILHEMTDRLLNIKPTHVVEIEGKLRDMTGNDDICLRADLKNNALKVFSKEDSELQYGYLFLGGLHPSYNFINFDRGVCTDIINALISILKSYKDHSAKALLKPLEGGDYLEQGIYHAMAQADKDGCVYVTVSWENQKQQYPEEFEDSIKAEIDKIAQTQGWNPINEDRNGKLKLNKVGDFNDLLTQIAKCSHDARWLRHHADGIYHNLQLLFCRKRDKDDTDKAIYRLCCIGLVEDVTIDYLSQTYELKIRNRSDEDFKKCMFDFFRKYFSKEQAEKRVAEIEEQKGRNFLDKCLGYLTRFVYSNLEKKRYRAIDDMRIACENSISERERTGNDDWLKEFIHLYFNSKYARKGYMVDGKDFSLTEDTDEQGLDGFDIVSKYLRAMTEDSSGSEVDNVKHLYGATLLCLRAHPENAALQLLLTYCITFLGAGTNETLKTNAYNNYIGGFLSLYSSMGSDMWFCLDRFNEHLRAKVHDDYIREEILNKGKETIMLLVHEEKLHQITKKYTSK
ncbi:MAG: DEAD/DEAH box helicase [Bacteroidales bacterium]|nr:DEAD/DEAH box helicase [Bacteroidales bacterium]